MSARSKMLTAEDCDEIRHVIMKYARAVDRSDRDLMLEVYHEGAIDDHGSFKLPAAKAVERILQAVGRSVVSQHHMTNVLIEPAGRDVAHVETYALCSLMERSGDAEQLRMLGLRYVDRFERRGHWAIANRQVVHDWSAIHPIKDRWATAHLLAQGSRDTEDPAYQRGRA